VYYCKLRHNHPGKAGIELTSPSTAFAIDGLTIDKDAVAHLIAKWPNRGDAVFVDYCVPLEDANSMAGS
jgi:hypothetical protein